MNYDIEPADPYFQVYCVLPEQEIQPGVTVTFSSLVDLTEVETIRDMEGHKHSYTTFVAKALSIALRDFPYANRRVFRRWWWPFYGPRMQTFHRCDIGIAVERDMPGRESVAFVDILRDAEHLSLKEINVWLHQLATSDATNNKQWHDMTALLKRFPYWLAAFLIRAPCWLPALWIKYRGAAALISSPGKYGVDHVATAWNWPLGLSFGYVKERPIVRQGQVVARPTFNLILNFDRRIMAGAQGAQFFKRIIDVLENAKSELMSLPQADSSKTKQRTTVDSV